jgi:hypothetical protein
MTGVGGLVLVLKVGYSAHRVGGKMCVARVRVFTIFTLAGKNGPNGGSATGNPYATSRTPSEARNR